MLCRRFAKIDAPVPTDAFSQNEPNPVRKIIGVFGCLVYPFLPRLTKGVTRGIPALERALPTRSPGRSSRGLNAW